YHAEAVRSQGFKNCVSACSPVSVPCRLLSSSIDGDARSLLHGAGVESRYKRVIEPAQWLMGRLWSGMWGGNAPASRRSVARDCNRDLRNRHIYAEPAGNGSWAAASVCHPLAGSRNPATLPLGTPQLARVSSFSSPGSSLR